MTRIIIIIIITTIIIRLSPLCKIFTITYLKKKTFLSFFIIIIVLFDDAEELTTETHFLCAFNLKSRIRIGVSFVILPYKQYFIR